MRISTVRKAVRSERLSSEQTRHVLHLRIVAEANQVDAVLGILKQSSATANLVHLPGVALQPVGDLILCDVAREGVSDLLDKLRRLGVQHYGSISVDDISVEISDAARQASRDAPGHAADAVVWEQIEERTQEETM